MTDTLLLDHCDVPWCDVVSKDGVLISADGGVSVWCPDHIVDDWLPELTFGRLGGCMQCHSGCITWSEAGCLHERCRRAWALGRPPEGGAAVKHGAYGRRSRSA